MFPGLDAGRVLKIKQSKRTKLAPLVPRLCHMENSPHRIQRSQAQVSF